MRDKLFEAFSSMKSVERDRFRYELERPGQQERRVRKLVPLCEVYLEMLASGDEVTNENLLRNLEGRGGLHADNLAAVKNQLMNEVLRFLGLLQLEASPEKLRVLQLKALKERELHGHYKQLLNSTWKRWPRSETVADSYFRYELAEMRMVRKLRERDFGLEGLYREVNALFDDFYALQKLMLACGEKSLQMVYKANPPADRKIIVDRLRQLDLVPKGGIGRLFFLLFQCMESHDPGVFQDCKSFLSELEMGNSEEIQDVYKYLINFATRKFNAGEMAWGESLDKLYAQYFRQVDPKSLNLEDLKNRISLLGRLGRVEDALGILESWRENGQISEDSKEYGFNRAVIYYYEGAYREAFLLLSTIPKIDGSDFYSADIRIYELKCLYKGRETYDYDEMIPRYLEKDNSWFSRKPRFSVFHLECYQNFIRGFSKLYNIWNKPVGKRKNHFERAQQFVLEQERIASRDWLLKELELARPFL